MLRPKRKGNPDITQMRRELEKRGVNIVCIRPDWLANGPDEFIMVRPKLRDVVIDAYKHFVR